MRRPDDRMNDFDNLDRPSGDMFMNRNGKDEQRVELFINNEYIGLYSLGYNPDIRIRPKNG